MRIGIRAGGIMPRSAGCVDSAIRLPLTEPPGGGGFTITATIVAMAMVFTTATVILAMKALRGTKAQDSVVALFQSNGWQVRKSPPSDDVAPDLVVSDGSVSYAIVLKISAEARPDRVIALLSQAILQARFMAGKQPRSQGCCRPWRRGATVS